MNLPDEDALRVAAELVSKNTHKYAWIGFQCLIAMQALYDHIGKQAVEALLAGDSVVVPVYPTREMEDAAEVVNMGLSYSTNLYKAMINARPGVKDDGRRDK